MVIQNIDRMIKIIEFLDIPSFELHQRACPNHYVDGSCSRCQDVCPVEAITPGREVVIEPTKCVRCGACSTICTNGVIRMLDVSDESVHSGLGQTSSTFDNLMIKCNGCNGIHMIKGKKAPKGWGELTVPCLGRVNETMLLRCRELGFKNVQFSDCDEKCPFKAAGDLIESTMTLAADLMEAAGSEKSSVVPSIYRSSSASHRRAFIFEAGISAALIMVGKSPAEAGARGKGASFVSFRRNALRQFLSANHLSGKKVKRKGLPFAEVAISSECDACEACSGICPSEALVRKIDSDDIKIYFAAPRCSGCGLCVSVCDKQCLQLKDEFDPSVLSRSNIMLQTVQLSKCSICGKRFVPASGSSTCLNCTKEERLQKSFLKNISG